MYVQFNTVSHTLRFSVNRCHWNSRGSRSRGNGSVHLQYGQVISLPKCEQP